ncbi:MAG: hypothetical protein EA407_04310 [Rhodobacteraceae bacterium]|nr:MAG: hypothetical protein EA407_04310 [Paracoccaceae bacterium]
MRPAFARLSSISCSPGASARQQPQAGLCARPPIAAVDRGLNRFALDPEAPLPDADDCALHHALFLADLHADCLKWDRDLLRWSNYGHADILRFAAGNTASQVFAMVTHSPVNFPWRDSLSANEPNHAAWLALVERRPFRSTCGRAFYQMDLFWDTVDRSQDSDGPEIRPILNASELLALIEARSRCKYPSRHRAYHGDRRKTRAERVRSCGTSPKSA